ncbi:MAG: hypothetical protein KIT84_33995, partial [Labilithrix sp.]|nr:hypothetical protein [Labilithrix sp.]
MLRSDAPPEAEYAMFDIGDIELRASEPGRVREHGYQTVASKARTRLANAGMSAAAARDISHAMQPLLAEAYARGAAARKVARYLEPSEVLRADSYDAATHLYHGVFLDLGALARDLELEHVGATLQALYLASLLEHEEEDTEIIIHTDECTKGGKPGTRTYKRPSFTEMQRLMNALGGLAHRSPTPEIGEPMPKAAVIDFLRSRQDTAPDDDARSLFRSLETSISTREMPEKGPLALPDLWDIEERIEANQFEGTLDMIDEAERRHGRTPGTTYLRARIALELRLEPPKLIAERVSALALSMTSFAELELLAAEAWLEAGDPRRAMPYARDLLASRDIDDGLLIKAKTLLERAETNKPKRRMSPTLVDAVRPAPKRRDAPADSEPPTPVPLASPAEPEAFTGLGIEDLVLEPETPPPAPPPLPSSSRSMRAAPAVPSSSRMPA